MRVGILTGGGDCPGLNPAIRGAFMKAMDYGYEMFGIMEGWKGMIEGEGRVLTLNDVEEIISIGGTIIGTSRTNPFKNPDDVNKVLNNMKELKLDALIALGGEDTLGVASKFYIQYGLKVVGVPKTMDNDLSCTDYTFGFDTSVTIAVDALERLRDTGRSHRRIMILEVMGRYAGWVALFTGIAGGADWILLPEIELNIEEMCKHLEKVKKRKGYAIVVVSEGTKIPELEKEQEKDAFGHVILKEKGVGEYIAKVIEEHTGIQTRVAVIGHIQRGGAPTLFDRMLGTRVGVKAVELVHEGKFGQMACLVGNNITSVPLEEATAKIKSVDKTWWELAKTLFK
jgi:6-phosphofructokinase 1